MSIECQFNVQLPVNASCRRPTWWTVEGSRGGEVIQESGANIWRADWAQDREMRDVEAASAASKEGNKKTAKGADVPCTDPDSATKQAASDEATSNNAHNAQAEGDKQQT
ncbi:hypothetical protein E4U16_005918 [Claviceps sp. LM84 group G4]|nr:hypothetical protein E4U16_005918 [Claviceps sp. LM84 group G4]